MNKTHSNTVTLKYPFDIKNIKHKIISTSSPFCSHSDVQTYDVQTFNAIKYECNMKMKNLKRDMPEFTHKIYAYRSTSFLPKGCTVVSRIRFNTNVNKYKNETHTNVELLPEFVEKSKKEEDLTEDEELLPEGDDKNIDE